MKIPHLEKCGKSPHSRVIPQAVWIASQPGLEGVCEIHPQLHKPSGRLDYLTGSGESWALHLTLFLLHFSFRHIPPHHTHTLSLSGALFEGSFEFNFDLPTPEREQRRCQIWGATVWNVVTPLLISFCNAPWVVALGLSAVVWTRPDFSSLRCCP